MMKLLSWVAVCSVFLSYYTEARTNDNYQNSQTNNRMLGYIGTENRSRSRGSQTYVPSPAQEQVKPISYQNDYSQYPNQGYQGSDLSQAVYPNYQETRSQSFTQQPNQVNQVYTSWRTTSVPEQAFSNEFNQGYQTQQPNLVWDRTLGQWKVDQDTGNRNGGIYPTENYNEQRRQNSVPSSFVQYQAPQPFNGNAAQTSKPSRPDQYFPESVANPVGPLSMGGPIHPASPLKSTPQLPPSPQALASLSEGRLTSNFMAEIAKHVNSNIIISPFGIWSVAIMILGAAKGNTAQELAHLLSTEGNATAINAAYKEATNLLIINTPNVESATFNVIARKRDITFMDSFSDLMKKVFAAQEFLVDDITKQQNKIKAALEMNNWISIVTKNRIKDVLKPDDFSGMNVMLGSASYFKGRWKYPFNKTATATDAFKNENDTIVTEVPMMRMRAVLKYAYSPQYDSQILELPYGDDKTSMVVFLPKRKVATAAVLEKMRNKSLLELIPREMSEEEVDVSLPSFSSSFKAVLNRIFLDLGAETMLNNGAELPGISKKAFISKISHAAEIETSEEGTTASAVTTAQVSYKTSSVSFHANRPFIYFINHVPSRLVLFAGKYSDPTKR